MRVLGADPGVLNLGLAVVEFSETGSAPVVLWSQNCYVGDTSHPENYARMLVPYLTNVHAEWGFTGIGAETPPMIQHNVKTTAMLQRVFGVVDGWAAGAGLPVRYRSPVTLKADAKRLLGLPIGDKDNSKTMMRAAVEQILGGKGRKTHHENDAVFAAWACWGVK